MKKRFLKRLLSNNGTTLIEGIIAMMIIGVASAMLVYGLYVGIGFVNDATDIDQYIYDCDVVCEQAIETYKNTGKLPVTQFPYYITAFTVNSSGVKERKKVSTPFPTTTTGNGFDVGYKIKGDDGTVTKEGVIASTAIEVNVLEKDYNKSAGNKTFTGQVKHQGISFYYAIPYNG